MPHKFNLIRQLEEISGNGWTAPHQQMYDGWLVRYANGYTRRANSVYPLYRGNMSLTDKIAYAEQFYAQRGLPTVFKLTEAAEPPELDSALAECDYSVSGRTSVQVRALTGATLSHPIPAEMLDTRPYASRLWLDAVYEMNAVRPIYQPVLHDMLTKYLLMPSHFVLLWQETRVIAAALMVFERGYAGIFDVVVHPEWRARGVGRALMEYLLVAAQQSDAHTAYLQVAYENTRAWRLYERLGFHEEYRYWYREKPLPVT